MYHRACPVNVLPAKPQQLPTTQPYHKERQECRSEAVTLDRWQEVGGHLRNGQGLPVRACLPWWLHQSGYVADKELALLRTGQGIPQDDAVDADRLRRQSRLELRSD